MENMLVANDIWFRYSEEDEWVLSGINLEVKKGEFLAVLGSNGCGKSTLAKQFNAILVPEKGDIIIEGINTKDENKVFDIRQKVGMVFQNPDNQIVATVVEEDVAFALENMGVDPKEIRERIDTAMQQRGVYEFRQRAPHNLSGGQKQRVAIAGIIAMRPDCIVLDEPTAMLDPSGRQAVMETIKQLNREYGITIVIITHYMDEAAQADRVAIMADGKIAREGTPKEIFSQVERMKALSLDVPQTCELNYEMNKIGCNLAVDRLSVEECAKQLYEYLEG